MTSISASSRLILLAFIASAAVAVVAWQVQRITADNQRRQQGEMLSALLETSHQAVNSWSRAHLATAVIWANSPELIKYAGKLLAMPAEQPNLLRSPLQRELREWLQPLIDAMGYQGYFIIGPGNMNLSSSRDENIGVSNLLTVQEDVLARMWAGQPALSLPWRSDVPLPDKQGNLREGLPTMFVGAPIHDDDGAIVAILTFRIDPATDFTKIFQQGRLGMTGETYAFNRRGLLISESRFDEQLRQSGLLAPGEAGILNLTLRNSGNNLLREVQSAVSGEQEVSISATAVADNIGMDLDGYLNYREVPVIGAWLWDDHLGFGIATEVEMADSYQPLRFNRNAIGGMALFSILLLCSLTWLFIRSRQQLFASEARLKEAQHIGRMGDWSLDVGSDVIHWSEEIYRIFGCSRETFTPTCERFRAMIHPNDAPRVTTEEQAAFTSGHKHSIDYRLVLPGGRTRWVHEQVVADCDSRGKVRRLSGTLQDITKRKRAEQALRESEMRFKAVLDNSPTVIYVKDLQGRYLFVNKTFSKIFGIAAAAAKGRRDHEVLPAAVADILTADDRKVYEAREPLEMEERIPLGAGEHFYIATKFCLRNEQGEPYAIGSIATDITQRMRTEEEREDLQRRLQQAQKMEAIGKLAGGIA
ncbi:MAG: PAS domain-containing protein, partial [Gammaproteobacteria bacterium]